LDKASSRNFCPPESESFFLASGQPLTSVLLYFQDRKPETAAVISAFVEKWIDDFQVVIKPEPESVQSDSDSDSSE
jgi:hypothetical protein